MLAVKDGKLDQSAFELRDFASPKYLSSLTSGLVDQFYAVPPQHHDIENNSVTFTTYTELVYDVPAQTSLINITGPVFDAPMAGCYAILDPEPEWWNSDMIPTANPGKPSYRADQTYMLLPTDPRVTYQLIIGANGNDTTCAVTGITTYGV